MPPRVCQCHSSSRLYVFQSKRLNTLLTSLTIFSFSRQIVMPTQEVHWPFGNLTFIAEFLCIYLDSDATFGSVDFAEIELQRYHRDSHLIPSIWVNRQTFPYFPDQTHNFLYHRLWFQGWFLRFQLRLEPPLPQSRVPRVEYQAFIATRISIHCVKILHVWGIQASDNNFCCSWIFKFLDNSNNIFVNELVSR